MTRRLLAVVVCVVSGCAGGGDRGGGPDGPAGPADAAVPEPDAYVGCTAQPELCNGVDDNCNGQIDEGFHLGELCDGADSDACKEGVITCGGCGDASDDTLEAFCNSVDDDCDGFVDEETTCIKCCDGPDPDLCPDDSGTCTPFGITCTDAGDALAEVCSNGVDDDCDGATDEVGAETCNGADDNCDGAIDEGCSCGPTELICNEVDDDCDGLVDDVTTCDDCCDAFDDTDACNDDHGVCTPFGISCSDDGVDHLEQCGNAADDDCDGAVDEGC